MPAPLAAAGIAAGAYVLTNIGGEVWHSYISPYFEPAQLDSRYAAFSRKPIVIPAPGDLLRLLNSAKVDTSSCLQLLRAHGILIPRPAPFPMGKKFSDMAGEIWDYLARFSGALPSPEVALAMLVAGNTHGDNAMANVAANLVHFYGMRDPWATNPETRLADWWERLAFRSTNALTTNEIIDAYWRGIVDDNTYMQYLKRMLVRNDQLNRDIARAVGAWMPGPSDIIRFIVRDAFNEEIVRKYGYDEEYPAAFQGIFELTGPGYPLSRLISTLTIRDPTQGTPIDPGKSWAHYYWRAHWDLPSPTQAYEMLRRLRPHGAERLARQLGVPADSIVTTLDDVRTLLKIADYPRYWRDRLIAISYNPITRTDLRMILAEGIPDPVPVEERLQDLGYSKQDAEVIAQLFRRRNLRQLQARGIVISEREVLSNLVSGLLTVDEARGLLKAIGIADEQVAAIINTAMFRSRIEDRKHLVRNVCRAYVRGIYTEEQLRNALAAAGLDAVTIDRHVRRCNIQRLSSSRNDTAAGIVWDWQRGLINTAAAIQELQRIGFTEQLATRLLRRGFIREYERRIRALQSYYRAIEAEYRKILSQRDRLLRETRRIMKEQKKSFEEAQREAEEQLKRIREEAEERRRQLEEEAREQAPEEPEEGG